MKKPIKFKHYSENDTLIPEQLWNDKDQTPGRKPYGFWISVESDRRDSWKDYWISEAHHVECPEWLNDLRYAFPIEFKDEANLLYIDTGPKFQAFSVEYRYESNLYYFINWERLIKKYQGIIIAPHFEQFRRNYFDWYETWDCASGVIWDLNAIDKVGEPEFQELYYKGEEFL